MSRPRAGSTASARRRYSDDGEATSPRALEKLEKAERREAARREEEREEEEARERRRAARAARKAAEEEAGNAASASPPAPADDEDEEAAARRARRAARKAAREAEAAAAAEAESASSRPVPAHRADKMDILRDIDREREDTTPRFRRAGLPRSGSDADELEKPAKKATKKVSSIKEEEETPEKPARRERRSTRDGEDEEEVKPRRRKQREESTEDAAASIENAAAFASPRRAKPSSPPGEGKPSKSARDRMREEERERERASDEKPEATEQVEDALASPTDSGIPDFNRMSSTSSAGWDAERNRITSIASAQKALDVNGLNRILAKIDAKFFQVENFNPFTHWNDPADKLEEWKEYVDMAVEKVVDAYHKGFNTATTSFSKVISKFSESQKIVKKLQENLSESKRLLQSRNQNIKDYYFQHRMASKMKEILEKIQYVVEVPQWIDLYMERKQYIHAVVLLQHTLSLLVSEDLVGIDGLLELRDEILIRKHFVQNFLIEELHRILYMKEKDVNAKLKFSSAAGKSRDSSQQQSSNSSASGSSRDVLAFNADGTRVKTNPLLIDTANVQGQQRSPTLSSQSAGASSLNPRPTPADSKYSPFYESSSSFSLLASEEEKYNNAARESFSPTLQAFLKEELQDNYIKNPEANRNKFLGMLVISLDHMNHLPSVKTQINKRVRGELLSIIQRETAIAREKSKFTMPRRTLARATESGYLTQGSEILVELIERIFHVLSYVLKNHLDVIGMIHTRLRSKGMMAEEMSDDGEATGSEADAKFTIEGVWQVMQIVLQTVLTDYLHSVEAGRGGTKVEVRSNTNKNASKGKKGQPDLLAELNFSFEDSTAPSVAKLSRGEKVANLRDYRMKTEDSALQASEMQENAAAATWVQPTPYNVTAVYRPVVLFTDHANALIASSQSKSNSQGRAKPAEDERLVDSNALRSFLKIFIEVSFLPRVEADVNIRLDEVLGDPSAFDARELQRDSRYSYNTAGAGVTSPTSPGATSFSALPITALANSSSTTYSSSVSSVSPPLRTFPGSYLEHNLLFKCVLDMSDLLKKNFQDMFLLPHSIPDFLKIIQQSVTRLMEKCVEKYMELVKSPKVPAGCSMTPAQMFLAASDKITPLLEDDPLLKILREGDKHDELEQMELNDELLQYFSQINPIYSQLFQRNARFDRGQLQFDTRVWSQLSLMAESLEWLADRLFHMNVFAPEMSRIFQEGDAATRSIGGRIARRPGGKYGSRHHGPHLDSFRRHEALERKRHEDLPKFISGKSFLDQKRWQLAEMCLHLSDRCLFTLRLELHTHLFYYLKEMQSGSYWCANDSTEPEPFVLELNRDLTLIDDAISKYLSLAKKKYVFGGCCELMTNILVKNMAHLADKRVNSKGVAKIVRNFFALQQNLNNIDGATSAAATSVANANANANAGDGNIGMMQSANTQMQESHFDRARQYYELLNCSQEDLHLFQLENPDMFSAEEYAALLSIQTQARNGDGRAFG